MGVLAAFLLGILFGPGLIKGMSGGGGTGPLPAPPEPLPSQPPLGYKAHPAPIPESVTAEAAQLAPTLRAMPVGDAIERLRAWTPGQAAYTVRFRAEPRGAVGIYVLASWTPGVAPPPTTYPPPTPPPASPPAKLPGGWMPHPSPIPQAVIDHAQKILPFLWVDGEGASTTEWRQWSPGKPGYDVQFLAQWHGSAAKRHHGVSALVNAGDWPPKP